MLARRVLLLLCSGLGLAAVALGSDADSGTCAAGGAGCSRAGALESARRGVQAYFDALHMSDADAFAKMWHTKGELLQTAGGKFAVLGREEFQQRVVKRVSSLGEDYVKHDLILNLAMLDDNTASTKVQIVLPGPDGKPMHFIDFLVFLRDADGFRIISKAFVGKPLAQAQVVSRPAGPSDFSAVASMVWDGYREHLRKGDAEKMQALFEPQARLTFVKDGAVHAVDSEAFLIRVKHRWSLPEHAPYSHLREDPRASAADTLLGIEFANPELASVTLRVGLPPLLYTDVLTVALLGGKWSIIGKTSVNEPFLAEEGKA